VTERAVDRRERPGGGAPEPEPGSSEPKRPPRPIAVEFAAAMLVINGFVSTITSVLVAGRISDEVAGIEPLALLMIGIGIGTMVLGVLTRYGHAWIVTVNVAAVAGFLGLTSATVQGLYVGTVDVVIVLILMWTRPWFAWRADGRDEDAEPAEAGPEPGRGA
jgi:hypothetical protein